MEGEDLENLKEVSDYPDKGSIGMTQVRLFETPLRFFSENEKGSLREFFCSVLAQRTLTMSARDTIPISLFSLVTTSTLLMPLLSSIDATTPPMNEPGGKMTTAQGGETFWDRTRHYFQNPRMFANIN